MKKWILLVGVVVASLVLYNLADKSLSISNASLDQGGELTARSMPEETMGDSPKPSVLSQAGQQDSFESQMITKLQASHGAQIAELSVQASLIKVKRYVVGQYPEDGVERFNRIIEAAFPEFAASILSIIERLEIYQEWLKENYSFLEDLSPMAKNGALWEKRRELFAADADIIWADERAKVSQGKIRMQEVFHDLNESDDIGMDEKLYQLQAAIDENLAGSVQDVAVSGGVIAQAFFNFDSVQRELAALPSEERQMAINDVRRQLGYPEELLESLEAKDQVRNQRWDNGLSYMTERAELVASVGEDELAEALSDLRAKYFKHEAMTIQKEEEMDFWRYKRKRKYGNN